MSSGQSITADRVAMRLSDGTEWSYTSRQAQRDGTPEQAREAIRASLKAALGDRIWTECIYVGMDDSYRFTDLERIKAYPDRPPPPREIVADKGSVRVVAFDGRAAVIDATEISKSDPDALVRAKLAELCGDADAVYAIEAPAEVKGGR